MSRRFFNWLFFAVSGICLSSCISSREAMQKDLGHFYVYKFGIKENKKDWKKAAFEDDIINITFSPDYNNIGLQLVNNSAEIITIDWNKVTFQENDIRSRVLIWGSNLARAQETLPVTVLKPGQGIRSGIIPVELVEYAPKDSLADPNGYVVHQMYPDYDRMDEKESFIIMGLLGTELFQLHIPVLIKEHTISYTFTFVPVEIGHVQDSPILRKKR